MTQFDGLPGPHVAAGDDLRVSPAAVPDDFLQLRVDRVQHVARLAFLGVFQLDAAGEHQPNARLQGVHVQSAHRQVLAGDTGPDVEPLRPQVVEDLDAEEADRLQRCVVLVVVVGISFQAIAGDVPDGDRQLGDSTGGDVDGKNGRSGFTHDRT